MNEKKLRIFVTSINMTFSSIYSERNRTKYELKTSVVRNSVIIFSTITSQKWPHSQNQNKKMRIFSTTKNYRYTYIFDMPISNVQPSRQ